MSKTQDSKQNSQKPPNDVRIGINSKVRNVIRYCNGLLKEKTSFIHFSAVGGAIGKLVDAVEVLKIVNPGLYQSNKLATVSYQSFEDDKKTVTNQKLYPKMEVVLSLEPRDKNEGFQEKYSEEERAKLYDLFNQKPVRKTFRGRRGGFRGRRGGSRGGRGFRGGKGFRGGRGNPRKGGRPPFRGGRGSGPRRGFRGGRGAPRNNH